MEEAVEVGQRIKYRGAQGTVVGITEHGVTIVLDGQRTLRNVHEENLEEGDDGRTVGCGGGDVRRPADAGDEQE